MKKIGRFQLEEVVGAGSYGKVYRSRNTETNEVFAIKSIPVEKFRKVRKLNEFTQNEINVLERITHPNIVRFVEKLSTTNNFYMVYEFCAGGTLEKKIYDKGKLGEEEALRYFAEILSAISLLNQHKVMHRDIKPSNIMLHNGKIKVGDFGFCKPMEGFDFSQTMVGSPIYMAPEILKGQQYGQKADVWSLGCALFEMLFGRCPFEEKTIDKLIELLERRQLVIPRDINPISKETEELLRRMLVVDPRKRSDIQEIQSFFSSWFPYSAELQLRYNSQPPNLSTPQPPNPSNPQPINPSISQPLMNPQLQQFPLQGAMSPEANFFQNLGPPQQPQIQFQPNMNPQMNYFGFQPPQQFAQIHPQMHQIHQIQQFPFSSPQIIAVPQTPMIQQVSHSPQPNNLHFFNQPQVVIEQPINSQQPFTQPIPQTNFSTPPNLPPNDPSLNSIPPVPKLSINEANSNQTARNISQQNINTNPSPAGEPKPSFTRFEAERPSNPGFFEESLPYFLKKLNEAQEKSESAKELIRLAKQSPLLKSNSRPNQVQNLIGKKTKLWLHFYYLQQIWGYQVEQEEEKMITVLMILRKINCLVIEAKILLDGLSETYIAQYVSDAQTFKDCFRKEIDEVTGFYRLFLSELKSFVEQDPGSFTRLSAELEKYEFDPSAFKISVMKFAEFVRQSPTNDRLRQEQIVCFLLDSLLVDEIYSYFGVVQPPIENYKYLENLMRLSLGELVQMNSDKAKTISA